MFWGADTDILHTRRCLVLTDTVQHCHVYYLVLLGICAIPLENIAGRWGTVSGYKWLSRYPRIWYAGRSSLPTGQRGAGRPQSGHLHLRARPSTPWLGVTESGGEQGKREAVSPVQQEGSHLLRTGGSWWQLGGLCCGLSWNSHGQAWPKGGPAPWMDGPDGLPGCRLRDACLPTCLQRWWEENSSSGTHRENFWLCVLTLII